MHGLVLASFQEYARAHGHEGGAATAYAHDRAYDDAELDALVAAVAERRGVETDVVFAEFGEYLGRNVFPAMAPEFFAAQPTLLAALAHVEGEIHERVRAVVPEALPPRLRVQTLGDHGAVIAYTSERRLCGLLEGLVLGTAAHYGERVSLEHPQCMLRGEPACSIIVSLE